MKEFLGIMANYLGFPILLIGLLWAVLAGAFAAKNTPSNAELEELLEAERKSLIVPPKEEGYRRRRF